MNLKRLTYRPDGQRISFSTHLFLYISLMFGIAFLLPPSVLGMASSPIFMFTLERGFQLYWGVAMVAVSIMNTAMLLTRNVKLSSITGVAGFCLWMYMTFAYIFMGYWFGLLVAALPNVLFWAWYSITVAQFRQSLLPKE